MVVAVLGLMEGWVNERFDFGVEMGLLSTGKNGDGGMENENPPPE